MINNNYKQFILKKNNKQMIIKIYTHFKRLNNNEIFCFNNI